MNLGKKIKDLRMENNLTQKQLAVLLSVSRQAVSLWEINMNEPGIDSLRNLCRVFKISADELLELDL